MRTGPRRRGSAVRRASSRLRSSRRSARMWSTRNPLLRGQAHEHDEPDERQDVQAPPREGQRAHGAHARDGHGKPRDERRDLASRRADGPAAGPAEAPAAHHERHDEPGEGTQGQPPADGRGGGHEAHGAVRPDEPPHEVVEQEEGQEGWPSGPCGAENPEDLGVAEPDPPEEDERQPRAPARQNPPPGRTGGRGSAVHRAGSPHLPGIQGSPAVSDSP